MIDHDEARRIVAERLPLVTGADVRVGEVRRMFLDDYTGWPSFATVALDQGSDLETFVALHEAVLNGEELVVPYRLDLILNAPRIAPDQDLSPQEEDAVFDYYGVPIDGVSPVVAHLGVVMVSDGDDTDERPVDSTSP